MFPKTPKIVKRGLIDFAKTGKTGGEKRIKAK
jgi:hypothetical protein